MVVDCCLVLVFVCLPVLFGSKPLGSKGEVRPKTPQFRLISRRSLPRLYSEYLWSSSLVVDGHKGTHTAHVCCPVVWIRKERRGFLVPGKWD